MRTAPSYTPVVGMRLLRTQDGGHFGQHYTITRIEERPGGFINLHGDYEETRDTDALAYAEYFQPVEAAASAIAPAQPLFRVGQEVIISERVREGSTGNTRGEGYECRIAADYVGERAVVSAALEADGRVYFRWRDGTHAWQLLPQYLDPVPEPAGVALHPATPAVADSSPLPEAAWRLARAGQPTASLMDYLWASIASPIDNLSRLKGTWTELLVHRAMLKIRRQVPNSYEEQLVKGHDCTSSRLWMQAWTAASRGGR